MLRQRRNAPRWSGFDHVHRNLRPRRSWLATGLLALLLGCGGGSGTQPTGLNETERRLVLETLDLIELQILAARDTTEARERRAEMGPFMDRARVDALLEDLVEDAERGRLVIGAIYDSLEARRTRLLPPPRIKAAEG